MRWLDALLGRTKRAPSDLDALFAITGAAVTLQAAAGLKPAGQAAVAFKPATGQAFAQTQHEVDELVRFAGDQSDTGVKTSHDEYGYHWYALADDDLEDLVTTVHMVNRTLAERGFGGQLLCSVFAFDSDGEPCHLVYLYKRGTFYPFAPRSGQKRDNELEVRLRPLLAQDLPVEDDLSRWFPLWGLPFDGKAP